MRRTAMCCNGSPGLKSGLLDLTEIEFDRGGAAKNRDRDTHLAFLVINVFNVAVEICKRAFLDADHLAHFEQDLGPWLLDAFFHLRKDFLDFAIRNRRGTITRAAQETGNPVGVLYQVPGLVGKIHLDQDIAREYASLGDGLLATLYLDDFFGRNQNTTKGGFQPCTFNTLDERFVHAFFHSGINVYDIPTLAHVCPLFPAKQQAVNGPREPFVDNPQQNADDNDEHKDNTRHLGGFFTRRPYHAFGFVVGVAPEAHGAAARFTEPGNDAGDHQPGQEHAHPGDGRLTLQHRVTHNTGDDNEHGQTHFDAVGGTGNGFYVAIRHIPACGAAIVAAM